MRTDYKTFLNQFDWQQGEHVSIIGTTGSGKTTLILSLSQKRTWRAFMATKKRDDDLRDALRAQDYVFAKEYPFPAEQRRVALWPPVKDLYSAPEQRKVFANALNKIYGVGGWCVVIDETYYFVTQLRIEVELNMLWSQARTLKISMIAGTQQPRHIPQLMLTSPTHLFFFAVRDDYAVRRMAEVAGLDRKELTDGLKQLKPFEFFYVNLRTYQTSISKVEVS